MSTREHVCYKLIGVMSSCDFRVVVLTDVPKVNINPPENRLLCSNGIILV